MAIEDIPKQPEGHKVKGINKSPDKKDNAGGGKSPALGGTIIALHREAIST